MRWGKTGKLPISCLKRSAFLFVAEIFIPDTIIRSMSEIQQENCSIVSHRIDQNFQKMEETTGYYIDFYVASIAEICEEEKPKPEKKFKEKKNMWK